MEDVSYNQIIQIIHSAQYIIADQYFVSLYPEIQESLVEKSVFYVDSPEESKCMEVYAKALSFLLDEEITRADEILVVGGGATSDLGGFVASTILRGVSWNIIPTTLLSMVDAAIGGKVGINTKSGKNLIGNFHEPRSIYYNYDFLNTLSRVEFNSGLGEVTKYAVLEKEIFDLVIGDTKLSEIVHVCADYKSKIVEADLRESGTRKLLNLGHSFGHAFEKTMCIPHGEAVVLGLRLILSLYAPQVSQDYAKILNKLKLEINFEKCFFKDFCVHLKKDKKTLPGAIIELVVPQQVGNVNLVKRNIEEVISEMGDHESYETYFY